MHFLQKTLIFLASVAVLIRESMVYMPTPIYYSILIVLWLYGLMHASHLNVRCIVMLCAFAISIIVNRINPIFDSEERFVAFVILLGAIGPLFQSKKLDVYYNTFFNLFSSILAFSVILSAAAYSMNLSFAVNASGFVGIFRQSMTMGIIAGVSSVYCYNYIFSSKGIKRLFMSMCFMTCLIALILSASRSAIGATMIGLVVYTFIMILVFKKYKYIKYLILCFFLFLGAFYNMDNVFDNVREKIEHREKIDSVLSGREKMWEDRLSDFIEYPIFGVGFASFKNIYNSSFNSDGSLEPGSSWLFVLSSTGIFGLTSLLLVIFGNFMTKLRCVNKDDIWFPLILSLLSMIIVHGFVEGYIISTGSIMCFYSWMIINRINSICYER